jgi:hypothetical protein
MHVIPQPPDFARLVERDVLQAHIFLADKINKKHRR